MGLISWVLWKGEKLGSKLISKALWPPCSASVLVIENNSILAVKKGDYYMLPGGMLERGESFEECARREAKEETGIDIEIKARIDEWSKDFAGVEVVFGGKAESKNLESSWEGKPVFLDIEEAKKAQWRWDRDIETLVEKYRESEEIKN